MLLRRVIEHVKTQNWTAVALDFVIVVVGVFIGIQVSDWNDARSDRAAERAYTMRLHSEVIALQATRAPLGEQRNWFRDNMATATSLLFSDVDRDLTEDECKSIAYSYVVSKPTDDLASLIELQSSGGLSSFQNKDVLSKLRNFMLKRARARDSRDGIVQAVIVLASAYPQLVQVTSPTHVSETFTLGTFQCDLEGMRRSPAFLNDYDLNQMGFAFHVRQIGVVNESLADLHQVLDEVLNITHEEGIE